MQKLIGKSLFLITDLVIDHTFNISKRKNLSGNSYIKLPKEFDSCLKYRK